jgi:ketosteroid isomerase-like protein
MSPAIQQDIQKNNRVFEQAVIARDLPALGAVYTSNARILPPGGEMISGRDNIQQFWGAAIEGMNVRAIQLETLDFEVAGETGYEIGRAILEVATEGTAPMSAKYVVVWKIEDGAWKWHVDIWNPNA